MPPELLYPALFAAGLIAGALNVVAGGGSFLTLPLLIFAGLPPTVANGTNRVAILVQNVGAVWGFDRRRLLDRRLAPWAALPAVAGAALGSWAALAVGDRAFQRTLAILMVVVTLWTLWDPLGRGARRRSAASAPREEKEADAASPVTAPLGRRGRRLLAAGFFAVGLYGGFVQAGVGFLILAATTLAGLDLVRGNALKVLVVLAYIPLSLGIFAWQGKVAWDLGLALAAGHLAGAFLGVHLTVLKGHRWVQRVVTIAVIACAVKLWLDL